MTPHDLDTTYFRLILKDTRQGFSSFSLVKLTFHKKQIQSKVSFLIITKRPHKPCGLAFNSNFLSF
jgi:hypothetical protein